jgi:hypothetical protein
VGISHQEFIKSMMKLYPHTGTTTTVDYPHDRLLKLQGTISEDLMRKPDMLDHNGDPCLFVVKNGATTGVTIGRATGIFSYIRKLSRKDAGKRSMEWAILPYDHKSGAFSASGDSGSIIADSCGRIGGLLTGGSGNPQMLLDITYATPFFWLLPRIKENGFPNAYIYPPMT